MKDRTALAQMVCAPPPLFMLPTLPKRARAHASLSRARQVWPSPLNTSWDPPA